MRSGSPILRISAFSISLLVVCCIPTTTRAQSTASLEGGAVVNIATQSGGSKFHGELFEYFLNNKLGAPNFFDFVFNHPPPFKSNLFSGTFGRIILGVAIILLEALLIAALLFLRRQSSIASQKLAESEREFSTLVENSPDIISRLDCDVRYIYISPGVERATGISTSRFIGQTPTQIAVAGYDWQGFEDSCRAAINYKRPVERSFEYKDRTYWTRIIPELSAAGLVESVMTISEDVTDRIRAEQELTNLTNRLFSLQDDERRRIARELHDGTAQNLFAISVNLAKLGQLPPDDIEHAEQLLAECQSLGDQSLQEIRTLSYVLHPPLLDEIGLISAIRWFVEGFTNRSGIYVGVNAQPIGRMPSEVEMALFRIVQEALTNVRRHSGSETASIRLDKRRNDVVLEIQDYGKGLSFGTESEDFDGQFSMGVGIPGMRQRLKQFGGRLEINSSDAGTTIAAVIPIANGTSYAANSGRGPSRMYHAGSH
jgi:PAS domain S-box-containing protein